MHKHTWKRSARAHGNPGRIFVECSECRTIRQATISEGHLRVFHSGAPKGGKSRVVSYRLKPWQEVILAERGETFVEFVNQAFKDREQRG